MTVKDYFSCHEGNIDGISDGVFNPDAWPHFDWPSVELCVQEIIENHGGQPFLGYKTLGMLMCWVMNLYKRKYGQNLPSGWYAVAKQLMASTERIYMADGEVIGGDDEGGVVTLCGAQPLPSGGRDFTGEPKVTVYGSTGSADRAAIETLIAEGRKRNDYQLCGDSIWRPELDRVLYGWTVKDAAGVWQKG